MTTKKAPPAPEPEQAEALRLEPSPKLNIHQRWIGMMHDVGGTVEKRQAHQGQGFFIDDVEAAVRPALVKWSVTAIICELDYDIRADTVANRQGEERLQYAHDTRLTLRITNSDKPDDFIEIPGFGLGLDQSDKGPGKAISYATKYIWLSSLHLRGQEEAENAAPSRASSPQSAERTSGGGSGRVSNGRPVTIPTGDFQGRSFDDPEIPEKELTYWATKARKPEYKNAAADALSRRKAQSGVDEGPPLFDETPPPEADDIPF